MEDCSQDVLLDCDYVDHPNRRFKKRIAVISSSDEEKDEVPSTSKKGVHSTSKKEVPSTSKKEVPSTSKKEVPSTSKKEVPSTSKSLGKTLRKQPCNKPAKSLPCPICTNSPGGLFRHIKEVHGMTDRDIKQLSTLKESQTIGKKYPCSLCHKKFVCLDLHLVCYHGMSQKTKKFSKEMDKFYAAKNKGNSYFLDKDEQDESREGLRNEKTDEDNGVKKTGLKEKAVKENEIEEKGVEGEEFETDTEEIESDESHEDMSAEAKKLLCGFEAHLASFCGSSESLKEVKKNRRQVTVLWQSVSRNYYTKHIFQPKNIKDWIDRKTNELAVGSILRYLGSLKMFAMYCNSEHGYTEAKVIENKVPDWGVLLRHLKGRKSRDRRVVEEVQEEVEEKEFETEGVDQRDTEEVESFQIGIKKKKPTKMITADEIQDSANISGEVMDEQESVFPAKMPKAVKKKPVDCTSDQKTPPPPAGPVLLTPSTGSVFSIESTNPSHGHCSFTDTDLQILFGISQEHLKLLSAMEKSKLVSVLKGTAEGLSLLEHYTAKQTIYRTSTPMNGTN